MQNSIYESKKISGKRKQPGFLAMGLKQTASTVKQRSSRLAQIASKNLEKKSKKAWKQRKRLFRKGRGKPRFFL